MDTNVLHTLQQEILSLQGYKPPPVQARSSIGLGPIESAFPYKVFPTRVIHELSSYTENEAAATNGFIAALLGNLLHQSKSASGFRKSNRFIPRLLRALALNRSRSFLWKHGNQKICFGSLKNL
ncbi:hypothetical protein [Niabella hibiscisoli]|uniref:hypothetical protein n=1 Tax=Niabella hibiscisoli TaxID=1825928 RepID=UPI001F1116A0|nr:hypothetical protein [Niabella hibiscisoli]MCH5720729.1 hypothetical protein [Niabella hibiscisoli]